MAPSNRATAFSGTRLRSMNCCGTARARASVTSAAMINNGIATGGGHGPQVLQEWYRDTSVDTCPPGGQHEQREPGQQGDADDDDGLAHLATLGPLHPEKKPISGPR